MADTDRDRLERLAAESGDHAGERTPQFQRVFILPPFGVVGLLLHLELVLLGQRTLIAAHNARNSDSLARCRAPSCG